MEEVFDRVNFGEWDREGFAIPAEFVLTGQSSLYEAVSVFYSAGGYDFFKVLNPEKYASRWLEFVGNLYVEIVDGIYKPDGLDRRNPLDEQKRVDLMHQGVPDIFTREVL